MMKNQSPLLIVWPAIVMGIYKGILQLLKRPLVSLAGFLILLAACSPVTSTPANTFKTPMFAAEATSTTVATWPSPTATNPPIPLLTSTPSPTPTACLDKTPAVVLPARKTPLEVKFISDGNIWLWKEQGGQARQITTTGDARSMYFSNDGQVIAFERGIDQYNVELWAVNRDGSRLRRLVSVAGLKAMGSPPYDPRLLAILPAVSKWISGTHTLAFGVYPSISAIGEIDPYEYGYWAVDADTLKLQRLPKPEPTSSMISPDGRQVAIITSSSLSLVNANGTNRRNNVLTFPFIGLGDYAYTPPIIWAPDSKSLHAIIPSADPFAADATLTTWMIPADGSPAHPLATFAGFPIDVYLSPNQQYIAFWKPTKPMSNVRELHLAKFDGSNQVIYHTDYVLEFLGWAPDSAHFVFWYDQSNQPQMGHICGSFAPLTDTPTASLISWVDSARFLFVSGNGQSRELRLEKTNSPSILVGTFIGDYARYEYNQEGAAVGQVK